MKVYDVITFFNELDTLEMRLNILDPYVDYFVINESPVAFSGNPKRLFFQENKERFEKFESKIIHHIFTENKPEWNQWERGLAQKGGSLGDLPSEFKNDDIIMYSDADEIPDLSMVNMQEVIDTNKMFICFQDCYYYYLNTIWEYSDGRSNFWRGTRFSTWKLLKRSSIDEFRSYESSFHIHCKSQILYIPHCGWHFSFLNGAESVKYKIQSYEHQELNIPIVTDNIQNNIRNLRDPFFRNEFKIRQVGVKPETHPQYLIDNLDRYQQHIYKP